MPAWTVAPVTPQPSITLVDWQVMQLDNGDRHLVGYALENSGGHASMGVVAFDFATLRAVSSSGRVYQLKGPPGRDRDAGYTWHRWSDINAAGRFDDVTHDVWQAHEAALLAGQSSA